MIYDTDDEVQDEIEGQIDDETAELDFTRENYNLEGLTDDDEC